MAEEKAKGMDDAQAQADRGGWSISVNMTTGGEFRPLGDPHSQEVGEVEVAPTVWNGK